MPLQQDLWVYSEGNLAKHTLKFVEAASRRAWADASDDDAVIPVVVSEDTCVVDGESTSDTEALADTVLMSSGSPATDSLSSLPE